MPARRRTPARCLHLALGTAACSPVPHLALGTAALATLSAGPAACAPAPAADATTELQIDGMVCASCSEAITAALRKLPGVHEVRVDHVTGAAVIRHDARSDRAALVAAVTALGYTAAPPAAP